MTLNGEDIDAIVRTVRFDGRQQSTGGETGVVFARQLLIASAINPRPYLLRKEGSTPVGSENIIRPQIIDLQRLAAEMSPPVSRALALSDAA